MAIKTVSLVENYLRNLIYFPLQVKFTHITVAFCGQCGEVLNSDMHSIIKKHKHNHIPNANITSF